MTDPDELEWHEHVRGALDFTITNVDFVLWIVVQAVPGARLDDEELRQAIDRWLAQLDADRVAADQDEPEYTWDANGLLVRFTAIPKTKAARRARFPVVGNPVPPAAYGSAVYGLPTVVSPRRADGS